MTKLPSTLDGPEVKLADKPTTLTGPDVAAPKKPPSTLDGPPIREADAPPSSLGSPEDLAAAQPKIVEPQKQKTKPWWKRPFGD